MIYICEEGHRINRQTGRTPLHETRCGWCGARVSVRPAPIEEQNERFAEKGGSRENLERWHAVRAKMRAALTSVLGGRRKPNPVSCVTGVARVVYRTACLNFFPALHRRSTEDRRAHDPEMAVQLGPTLSRRGCT